jgi:iron-sulfur cluster assembly protein
MFKVTSAAAEQIRNAAKQGGMEGLTLRLAAHTLADGAVDYRMGFDEVGDDDILFDSEGIKIVMAPEYVPLMDATVLDYVELGQGEYQFIFLNPRDGNYSAPTEV